MSKFLKAVTISLLAVTLTACTATPEPVSEARQRMLDAGATSELIDIIENAGDAICESLDDGLTPLEAAVVVKSLGYSSSEAAWVVVYAVLERCPENEWMLK